MKHHWAAWDQTAREHGISLTAQKLLSLAGKPSTAIMKLLCEEQGLAIDIDSAVKRKADIYCELAVTTQPIDIVLAVAQAAKAKNIPIAVATGGSKRQITGSMAAAGISSLFDAVVCADVSYFFSPPLYSPFIC
jgi:beta-phosphoglucomutase-like phosphatase (HAD superfamily)